jgi:hypothetical protein
MIIENLSFFFDNVGTQVKPARNPDTIVAFLETHREIEYAGSPEQLQLDLIQNHWPRHNK